MAKVGAHSHISKHSLLEISAKLAWVHEQIGRVDAGTGYLKHISSAVAEIRVEIYGMELTGEKINSFAEHRGRQHG